MTRLVTLNAPQTVAPPKNLPLEGRRRAVAIFAVLSAMTLAVLDAGMANVALPTIGRALDIAPANSILIVTAYQAGLIMALLPLGAIGEHLGHRRVFTGSVVLFALASGFCAASSSLPSLIVARFLQGLGGAGIMALGVALLRFTVPNGRLGAAIGWNALTVALAAAAGPSVGALIVSLASWPWLFAVNLPIAALTLLGSRALPPTPRRSGALDVASIGLNASGFATLILAAEVATTRPQMAPALLAGSVIAFLLLIRREAPKAAPLLPLDLLRGESFRLSVIASVCCFAAQSAGLLALPFRLQHELHLAPLETGLYVTVWPLSVAVAALIAGRLSDRLSTAWLCAIGAAALSAGLAGTGFWSDPDLPVTIIPVVALAGFGFGLFQSPNNRNMFLAAPADRSGAAGGLQGTARVAGQTLGALMVALLLSLTSMDRALELNFAMAAMLALTAGVVSLLRILA